MRKIETGIDRLVELVSKEKKISVDDAAKQLGVPKEVVQEWADFLDEEGLISVEYSLSKVWLEERKLTKKEVAKKEKQYKSKKEAFVRKVDTALKKLEKETTGFEEIKRQYYSLRDEIGDEIQQVKDEVEELRHYEDLKKSIDRDILKQKMDYEKALGDIHKRISNEEKRYGKIHEEIAGEEKNIEEERKELSDVKQQEDTLVKRIEALKSIISSIKKQLESEQKNIGYHEERLVTLRDLATSLEKDIKEKREKELGPLIASSSEHQQKILKIQEQVIEKIKARKKQIEAYESQGEEIAKRFEKFFAKKARTEKIVTELEEQKEEMKHELEELVKKAKGFDLTVKGADMQKHVRELNKQFNEFDKKRDGFAGQLQKLRDFIAGK